MQKKKRLYEKGVLLLLLVVVFFVFERCPRERERRDGTERELRREKALFARELFLRLARVYSERERERERAGFDIR